MEWGIEDMKDLLEVGSFIATIIGGIAILAAVRSYSISRKQLNFTALESCIKRYRDQFLDLDRHAPKSQVLRYIDLVNEELFYFEHNYLPVDVAEEWIDGMIEHLPIFDPTGKVLNPDHCIPVIVEAGLLDPIPFQARQTDFYGKNDIFRKKNIWGRSAGYTDSTRCSCAGKAGESDRCQFNSQACVFYQNEKLVMLKI